MTLGASDSTKVRPEDYDGDSSSLSPYEPCLRSSVEGLGPWDRYFLHQGWTPEYCQGVYRAAESHRLMRPLSIYLYIYISRLSGPYVGTKLCLYLQPYLHQPLYLYLSRYLYMHILIHTYIHTCAYTCTYI